MVALTSFPRGKRLTLVPGSKLVPTRWLNRLEKCDDGLFSFWLGDFVWVGRITIMKPTNAHFVSHHLLFLDSEGFSVSVKNGKILQNEESTN